MRYFLLVFMLSFSTIAQSIKTKTKFISGPLISYAKEKPVKDIDTYLVVLIEDEYTGVNFNEQKLQESVDLQSFTVDDENPKILFAIQGLKHDDFRFDVKRNKAKEEFIVKAFPKPTASIDLLVNVNGLPTQYHEFPVEGSRLEDKTAVDVELTYSFKEVDDYLDFFDGGSRFHAKSLLINDILNKLPQNKYLDKIGKHIKRNYDTRLDYYNRGFVYLKNKENPKLEEETIATIVKLENGVRGLKSINDIKKPEVVEVIAKFKEYWKEKLSEYTEGKKIEKVRWGILKNIFEASLLSGDISSIEKPYEQIIALNTKKLATYDVKQSYKNSKEGYENNFNSSTNIRIFADSYEVDYKMKELRKKQKIDNINEANVTFRKSNNLNELPGYLITKEGQKYEGNINLLYHQDKSPQFKNVVSLDLKPGRVVQVSFNDEKGKRKRKGFKAEKIKEVVVGDKRIVPVRTEKNILDALSSIQNLTAVPIFLMEVIYESETLKVYKNPMTANSFYLLKKGEDKSTGVFNKAELNEKLGLCEAVGNVINQDSFILTTNNLLEVLKLREESGCN